MLPSLSASTRLPLLVTDGIFLFLKNESPWGIVASSLLNYRAGLRGALGLASQTLFSFVFIAQGSSWHLKFPSHSPFAANCCYPIPGEVDGLDLEAPVVSMLQLVSLKC